VAFIEDSKEVILAKQGSKARLLDCMSFAEGPGVTGWVATGAPELVLFDARLDQRCDPDETLKRRIGSFTLIPLWTGTQLAGYLSASSQLAGGIDLDQVAALRLVSAELSRAFERITGSKAGGLMTPLEFSRATAGRDGAYVYLEPLRKEQMITSFGFASYEEALRKLAHQVRAKLPEGSCLCRRDQGDFLVFLDAGEEFARDWANEVAASASFIALSSSETAKRVPLALRAKVAQMTPQSNRLSKEFAA
jgi:GGDEF domain-containing protein